MNGDIHALARLDDGAKFRGSSPLGEITAEFHPVSPSAFRSERRFRRIE
jgi:hypothetical protein